MAALFKRSRPKKSSGVREVRASLANGEPLEALRKIDNVLSRAPNERGAHALRGICLSRLGRADEALREFELELESHPQNEEAQRGRERLKRKLARPPIPETASKRSWRCGLPHDALQSIQNGLHNYSYRGVPMLKNPFDVALYPLLLWELKPRTIFEIGSKNGGSALWFADLLGNLDIDGHVHSIDIVRVDAVSHPRVTFLPGNGRDLSATFSPHELEKFPRPWLVIEDADHQYETSIAVLRFFHPWLRPNEFIVVEDGIISDLNQDPDCNSGPHRALKEFLGKHGKEYKIDNRYCDFFGPNFTWCTNGYLRKLGAEDTEFETLREAIRPYTMLNEARLRSLFSLAKDVCERDVPGNFVECGVAGGGSSALLASVIARYSKRPRRLFACDTFTGMPKPSAEDVHRGKTAEEAGWGEGTCAAPIDSVLEICEKLGVREFVEPVKGLFSETLPANRARFGEIALLHMDGDWYSSTRDILHNLFDRVGSGGRIQIDDYGFWEGCKRALEDFERERGLIFELNAIDGTGVWMAK